MPNKTQEYLNLAQQTAKELTRYWENWTDYLTTASRLYKYSYADQLMIYAQRPDATACASFDLWNDRMNRYIRRGSKGIALLDQSSSVPRLHYVFDVSDTGVRRNSRDPDMWQLGPDLVQPVSEMLAREYGVQQENLGQQIADICGRLVDSYWDNNSGDILDIVDGSLLMGYDEAGQEFQFKSAAAISITYAVLERCGFEPEGHFDRDDFQAIFSFSTPAAVYALGTAVSECSRELLRSIERTVKTTIRRRNVERSQYEYEQQERDLLESRRLSASEPDPAPAGESIGQVRATAPDLPDEASPGTVQLDAPVGNSASAPVGSGAERGEPDTADHAEAAGAESGSEQRAASDGVGAAHEQPERTGRGTGDERADLQLSFFDTHIPTEAKQIESIDQAESEKSPSAFSLSQADIENALRRGSNFENSKLRIWKIYQLQPDRNLRAKALAKEYAPNGPGGSSHTYLDGSRGWLDHDSKGLTFEHYPDHQKILLRWNQVEKYIDLMIQSDRYLSDKEKRIIDFPLELNAASAAEYTALKEQYPDTLIGFEAGGNFMFYGEDAAKVAKIINSALFMRNTALGEVQITGFLPSLWAKRAKELWSAGNDVYLAGLNEDGTHHQTKHLRKEDYLPIGSVINMDDRRFRVDSVDFDKDKVSLQDMALADARMPIFREEPLTVVRELYEQQDEALDTAPEKTPDYNVGDSVVVDLPTRTIEGTIGYVGETDVRIDTSAQGYSWSNEVLNKQQFEDGLRQDEPELSDEELDKLPTSVEVNGEWQTFPDAAAADKALNAEPVPEAAGNFHITDDHLGEGGAKQKYARNVEAIRTLFQLEQEHRGATAEEQQVLSQYVGWGGLPDVFDPDKGNWAKEYSELKGLLSEDEYAAARSSVLNAHYTSPTVIRAIYDAVEKMGFRNGNILEPSMGIGNFFGMLPDTMQDSRLYGVELDSVTGRIAQKLYPDANIKVAGFETTDCRDFYDLAVGNVPFGQYRVNDNPEFAVNVTALEKAQPKDLEASEIDVRLGATWLAPEIIQKFMAETFQIPYYLRHAVKVRYSPYTAEWRIEGKSAMGRGDIISSETYGTSRANAYKILEDTLNLKDVRIYDAIEDEEGKLKRILNKTDTMLAQQKQQVIKDAFANWIWKDPQRRIALVKQYNELFNSSRPREYDGSHIHLVGMNPEITLREHQRNAIAHVLYGGNTLLAHEVGAGKTFEMAASAMEAKRLGLCQKSLFVVPNHLTEQWASEFLHLYPNAKLLVARKKDFETANRKKFCARIATGDYDAVIIGHSQFERIPLSYERQERIIQEQIDETLAAIEELKANAGENFSIKQMEKTRKTLETKLEKLRSDARKDDVITFEQLGVDRLFVDESHFYKNLFLTTKMRNVAGLSTSEAQKSSDMFGKCRYLDEITGGRGVVFATGTPMSNSMSELYTVMRYLQYGTLQQKGLTHFDCWASTFGETTTAIELAPEGTGYRARTRFAKFFNLPELMSMFKEVADIKTSDQLHLPVPDAKFETVVAKPSEIQKEMVQELSKRAAKIHSGAVDASEDNMLCVTNDGRKIGLDVRLMNPILPDDPNSKLNTCVRNVLQIWEDGKEQKLTQLLFCDLSTPKNDGNFNVYDDVRKKLVAAGVPENEIEFIHNADTEAKKAALFSKVRSGDVRILLGSTAKMGAGTNVQSRLVAMHHLDVGWKPSDMTQRNGRIIRQGNMNKKVKVFNYVTEGTFDSYLFQTLENKQRFISQIMTSKSPVRSCDDVDEQALSYAEIKALCAGNPLIKEKMDLDVQVAKLKVLKADHQSQKFRLEDKLLTKFPADIQETNAYLAGVKLDAELATAHPQEKEGFCGITIKGVTYDEKKTAGERLLLACSELLNSEEKVIGSYRGFELSLRFDTYHSEYQALLKGQRKYPVALGKDPLGCIIRLDNSLNNFPERISSVENELATLKQQQAAAQIEVEKPFPQEEELAEKSARLAELNAQLDMDEKSHEPEQDEEPRRSSVLAALEEKSDKVEPIKPFKSYLDKDGDAR